ncbi:MAG: hypothetical protein ACREPR_17445 [Brasilonema sp.]
MSTGIKKQRGVYGCCRHPGNLVTEAIHTAHNRMVFGRSRRGVLLGSTHHPLLSLENMLIQGRSQLGSQNSS